jgi:Zn-dependent metalloprotease
VWDVAGVIWYAALCDPSLSQNASFTDFARVTLKQAQQIYGTGSLQAQAVQGGWDAVRVGLT